jgi:hypothetical protein
VVVEGGDGIDRRQLLVPGPFLARWCCAKPGPSTSTPHRKPSVPAETCHSSEVSRRGSRQQSASTPDHRQQALLRAVSDDETDVTHFTANDAATRA